MAKHSPTRDARNAWAIYNKLVTAGAVPSDGDAIVYDAATDRWIFSPAGGGVPGAHAGSHENGGADEISVAGLSGLLADDQNPVDHAADHENAGGDEIDVTGLSGVLADAQNADQLQGNDVAATAPAIDGQVLAWDAGAAEWGPRTLEDIMPRMSKMFDWREDFIGGTVTSGGVGENGWASTVSGAGAALTSVVGESNHPGIIRVTPGTTNAGYQGIYTFTVQTKVIPNVGMGVEMGVNIETLSTAADEYVLRCGLGTSINAGAHTQGIWFEYDRLNFGDNWQRCTVDGGAITRADTGVAVATGWVRLRFVKTAAAAVVFYINDAAVGTNAAAIPSGGCSPNLFVNKTAGTTALYFYYDYFHIYGKPSAAR